MDIISRSCRHTLGNLRPALLNLLDAAFRQAQVPNNFCRTGCKEV